MYSAPLKSTPSRTLLASLLCAVALLFAAAPATAQEPSEEELKKAQEHFTKGAEMYATGDFGKAVVEFLRGYRISKDAMFLYNMSLAYHKLGNVEEALNAARKATTETGMPPSVALRNDARLVALETIVEAQDTAKAFGRVTAREEKVEETDVKITEKPVEPLPEDEGFGALGWAGVGLTVVGTGGLVGSAFMDQSIGDKRADYEAAAAVNDTDEYNRLQTEITDDQGLAKVLLFGGSGLAAVGVTLIIIELTSGGSEAPPAESALIFTPADGGGIVGWQTPF